jgi:deazaflavin-dependent oxidoreductase (nitroreductase family)
MSTEGRTTNGAGRAPGTPGRFSRWMQRRSNERLVRKVRGGKATFMGMDVLVLHTVGRRSGAHRETPLMWLPDEGGAVLVVASGGGSRNPDWHANLVAHPDDVAIELPGRAPVPAAPHELDGAERERAWQRVAGEQPRIARYQSKAERQYPLVRLTPR